MRTGPTSVAVVLLRLQKAQNLTTAQCLAVHFVSHDQAIPILSPLLFMHVGHPYIPHFKIRRIFVSPPFYSDRQQPEYAHNNV